MPSPSIGLPLLLFPSSFSSPNTTETTRFTPQCVKKGNSLSPGLAEEVAHQLEELFVAIPWFTGKRGGGRTLSSLLLHQLMLPLLSLWKLGCNDHEAQIDHEERTNLKGQKIDI